MNRRAFVLLEVMLAVGIFAVGVLGLGYCVNNCLNADIARTQDQLARLALENRMAEIESGAVIVGAEQTDELKGMFAGMKLRQERRPLKIKNEEKEDIEGISVVDLEVGWETVDGPQSKTISFYTNAR
jgi:hypothetical protein